MKRSLVLGIMFLALLAFELAARYNQTLGSINQVLTFVFFIWVGVRLWQLREERKKSGVTEEEYLLRQAGGATGLLSQSITVRAIGWLCAVAPVVLVLVIFMGTKSLPATVMSALLLAVICIPCAIACFRTAAKSRRVAEDAGAKLW